MTAYWERRMTFYERGREAALENLRHGACGMSAEECPGCWSDVPAQLTATYSEAPMKREMEQYGRGYFQTLRQGGITGARVEGEEGRLARFIEAGGRSRCETHFFGRAHPDNDRRSGVRRFGAK